MLDYNKLYEILVLQNLRRYKKSKANKAIALVIHWIIRILFNCDINLGATIHSNVRIPHAVGIVIGSTAVIHENVIIMPNVVIGSSHFPPDIKKKRHATIERNCLIGANAVIIGNIIIGENSIIGAGAVVTKNIPANSVVTGNNTILNSNYV